MNYVASERAPQRNRALDVLRAIAILLVLGRHVLVIPESLPGGVKTFFTYWQTIGWIGVDLFFVLSGYLVSGLLFSEFKRAGQVNITRFLIRRGFKIYPPFYLFTALSFLGAYLHSFPLPCKRQEFLGELLFLQNYLAGYWNHTWSLAVEEHFYLLLALLVFVVLRTRQGANNPFSFIPSFTVFALIAILCLRAMTTYSFAPEQIDGTLILSHLRMDSLLFGVLLSYLQHFKKDVLGEISSRYREGLVVMVFLAVMVPSIAPILESRPMQIFGLSLLMLGFGALLLITISARSSPAPIVSALLTPLAYIGRQSYSIYLWHMMIYYLSLKIFPVQSGSAELFYLQVSWYFVGSIAGGALMALLIETPSLRIRNRFFPT